MRDEIAGQALHFLSARSVLLDHLLGELPNFFALRFLLRELGDLDLVARLAMDAVGDLLIAERLAALAWPLLARLGLLQLLARLERLRLYHLA